MFWRFIRRDIALPFLVGSFAGTAIGARIYFELPGQVIAVAIALVMLVAIWLPEISWRPRIRHPWAIVGFVHSLLSTLFAYGAVLHAVALHAGLNRRQMVATLAGCLSGMSVFKIVGYAWYGFDYRPYLLLIVAAVFASIFGTWLGKRLSERLPEKQFRIAYRVIITVTAIRLLYTALIGHVG